jgi:hypothetical protein
MHKESRPRALGMLYRMLIIHYFEKGMREEGIRTAREFDERGTGNTVTLLNTSRVLMSNDAETYLAIRLAERESLATGAE